MSTLRTLTATLACPSCAVPSPRIVAVIEVCDAGASQWEARIHECVPCWKRRAVALGLARTKLRATGDLGETVGGRSTWLGRPVDDTADPVLAAMQSELLRLGLGLEAEMTMRLSPQDLGLLVAVDET